MVTNTNMTKESSPVSCSSEPCNESPTTQQIAERYLKDVEWMGPTQGRCQCPGHHRHTARSHRNDCWIFINGTPTVTCLHQSCTNEVSAANSQIRSAWSLFQPPLDEVAMAAARSKAAERCGMEAKARASLPEILKQFKWDLGEIDQKIKGETSSLFITRLFNIGDIVWLGEPEDSGNENKHRHHFETVKDWDMLAHLYGNPFHYTTASTYNPGSYSRSNANVLTTPYLIVEGDKVLGKEPETNEEKLANKNACGAIFNWLRSKCGLNLRAVVDSGNKSLHGWYDMPNPAKFEELKIILPAMGCDRAMFKPSQPARLPGVIRNNGNEQKLLWIS